jgi:hypothetical protein
MEAFKKVMSEKIMMPTAEAVLEKGADLKTKKVVAFFASKGQRYDESDRKLMVIGRALYGWELPREFNEFKDETGALKFADSAWEIIYKGERCPNQWVLETTPDYNPKRSAFWRVIKQVGLKLGVYQDNDPNWSSYILWSNLYKLNPDKSENPSEKLCDIQYPGCAELLEMEIEEYKPNFILFLTGLGWAYPFLLDIDGFKCRTMQSQYVSGRGIYDSSEVHAKVVVSIRPERQNESSFVNDVISSFLDL